jgi:hypothetical protein
MLQLLLKQLMELKQHVMSNQSFLLVLLNWKKQMKQLKKER